MINAIVGAPLWVWAILGYLLFVGVKAMRAQFIYLPKIFMLPVVFVILNFKTIVSSELIVKDLIFLLSGAIVGFSVAYMVPIKIIKSTNYIKVPGNYFTVVILLLFFIMKFIFGYLQAVQPLIAIQYSYLDAYTSAILTGFFLGRAFCYIYRFYSEK